MRARLLTLAFGVLLGACAQATTAATPTPAPPPTAAVAAPTPPPTSVAAPTPTAAPTRCEPTAEDQLGPFYVPNAPIRASVGSGYVLSGTVRAVPDCPPIANARIELWLANPQGEYDDARRATVVAGAGGEYRFESHVPVPYGGRPPHIHVRVSAAGYRTLVTQHYTAAGRTAATFDLVLRRE